MSSGHSVWQQEFHFSSNWRIWHYAIQLLKDQQKSKTEDVRLEIKAFLVTRKILLRRYMIMDIFKGKVHHFYTLINTQPLQATI